MPTNPNPTIELLTPDDLAKVLQISKAGVYRLISRRQIRFYKVMGSIRFDRSDIASFLESNQVEIVGSHKYGNTKN